MSETKTESVSYRVTGEFKELLKKAAEHERRSQTNVLETLLFDYCRKNGIVADSAKPHKGRR
jgi:hypothetical protein